MALFGRQKDYDENGDGRLSSSEWQEWYWETYGADLEREERRKKAEAKRAAEVRRELQWREALSPPLRALERWKADISKGMWECYGDEEALKEPCWKLLLYTVSRALRSKENRTERNQRLVNGFFHSCTVCTPEELWSNIQKGKTLFEAEYRLEPKWYPGTFWQEIRKYLLPFDPYLPWPDWLYQIVYGMGQVEEVFTGTSSYETLVAVFERWWTYTSMFEADRAMAVKAVQDWDFSWNRYALTQLLATDFPKVLRRWSAEELLDLMVYQILGTVYREDPETAIQMWRLLLDTAGDRLKEEEIAVELIDNAMDSVWWPEKGENLSLTPIVKELERDDRFVRQVFQSADVGWPLDELLAACTKCGALELRQKLRALLNRPEEEEDE